MNKNRMVSRLILTAVMMVFAAGCSPSSAGIGGSASSTGMSTDGKETVVWEDMEKLSALDAGDIRKITYFVLDEGGGVQGEVTDPETIENIFLRLKALTLGEPTDMMWTDAGSLVTLDTGKEELSFSFDGYSVELSDERYEVGGLDSLERYLFSVWEDDNEKTVAVRPGNPLRTFCNDEELDEWFDALSDNPPESLSYWNISIAPWSYETTETALMLEAAEALMTVSIGEESDENPDNVADAMGENFYFRMADNDTVGFSFSMGCFLWNGKWYDVEDYGDLPEISGRFKLLGNPDYTAFYSEDRGFHVEAPETCDTEWVGEEAYWGGLYLYPNGAEDLPFVEIKRYPDVTSEEGTFLQEEYTNYIAAFLAERQGASLKETVGPVDNDVADQYGDTGAFMSYDIEMADGSIMRMRTVAMKIRERMTGEYVLVQFIAGYDGGDAAQEQLAIQTMERAIKTFSMNEARTYEKGEVQPGSLLPDFINDDKVREWFTLSAEQELELTLNTDHWYDTMDQEIVHAVIDALQTVRIGERSDHVGGSGREIYLFYNLETDYTQEFAFFEDNFDYNGKHYEVLDWGDLHELNLKLEGYEILQGRL